MSNNYGNDVSRVLLSEDRNFNTVVFEKGKPPLDSEFNLLQDIILNKSADIVRKMTPSGFLNLESIETAPEDRSQLNSNWPNVLILKNPSAIVNGWIIKVGGGTNQVQPGGQFNIWKTLSNSEEEVAVIGHAAPYLAGREDLLFLEVWQKLVTPADTIYKYGFVQSALDSFTNDLIDPNIEIKTTTRVQIQYRLRWVTGVDFTTYRNGLGFPGCFAQGPLTSENTGYYFSPSATDPGLYVAGDGSLTSQLELGTVDGFVYAIPIARVHRRNREAFSLINQNGSSISILDGALSDRPDGLFYDEIAARDVEDLRHQVSLVGFDLEQLRDTNLELLLTKTLPGVLKNSPLDHNLSGNILLQVDGISTQTRSGINDDDRDPDSFKRVFSEAKETQKISYYIPTVVLDPDKIWFVPVGKKDSSHSYEYELFDEKKYYIANSTPVVKVWDDVANTVTVISGGTWEGLGVQQTWNYLPITTAPRQNKIVYTPTSSALLSGKKVIFEFVVTVREGGGVDATTGGFSYPIANMYKGFNDKDGSPIDFNLYTDTESSVDLVTPRIIGDYTDTAIARSISHFESALEPASTSKSKYKAGVVELSYYQISTSSTETISSTLYGRQVFSILSVYHINSRTYLVPQINKIGTGFELTGLAVDTGDILKYTLLLGNYTVDYIPHVKGIRNIAKMYDLIGSISSATVGSLNIKAINSRCDTILAVASFFDGVTYNPIVYIQDEMVLLDSLTGINSAILEYTLPEISSGSVSIPVLGYYNPGTDDSMYFEYEHIPYRGILQTLLSGTETQRVKILNLDDKLLITTAGTGTESQIVPIAYKGLTDNLPITSKFLDSNLFGENLVTPITGGLSSLRRIPIRDMCSSEEVSSLKPGEILTLKLGSDTTATLRGGIITSPKFWEQGINFVTPLNHMTSWVGIVEGLDNLKGELFLMVITTMSSIYNITEGYNVNPYLSYEYLEEKGIYKDNALGLGSETILRNNLTGTNLSQNLGGKIYGSVDLFPLKYRPLILD